jgi:predicted ATP-grasp superfamily ATP-dependent carboligase
MSDTNKWMASARVSLDELEKEVKRLRDELDKQMEYIEWLEEFAPKAGKHNTSWEAYELAKESEEE